MMIPSMAIARWSKNRAGDTYTCTGDEGRWEATITRLVSPWNGQRWQIRCTVKWEGIGEHGHLEFKATCYSKTLKAGKGLALRALDRMHGAAVRTQRGY